MIQSAEVLVALRQHENDAVLCAFNFGSTLQTLALPRAFTLQEPTLCIGEAALKETVLSLPPYSAMLAPVMP